MEEAWVGKGRDIYPFPLLEAKNTIRQLSLRLVDYILTVQAEIVLSCNEKGARTHDTVPRAVLTVPTVTQPMQHVNQESVRGSTVANPRGKGPVYFGDVLGRHTLMSEDWNT